MIRAINKFTTLTKNTNEEDTYYITYNICLWLEDWFPGYSFMLNKDITDNTIVVNISKILPDDDIGKREIHVACAKIPIVFIIDDNEHRIIQIVQDAIGNKINT